MNYRYTAFCLPSKRTSEPFIERRAKHVAALQMDTQRIDNVAQQSNF